MTMENITSDTSISFNKPKEYKLDPSKITSLEDVITVLVMADIKIYSNFTNFEKMKPFLKELR